MCKEEIDKEIMEGLLFNRTVKIKFGGIARKSPEKFKLIKMVGFEVKNTCFLTIIL